MSGDERCVDVFFPDGADEVIDGLGFPAVFVVGFKDAHGLDEDFAFLEFLFFAVAFNRDVFDLLKFNVEFDNAFCVVAEFEERLEFKDVVFSFGTEVFGVSFLDRDVAVVFEPSENHFAEVFCVEEPFVGECFPVHDDFAFCHWSEFLFECFFDAARKGEAKGSECIVVIVGYLVFKDILFKDFSHPFGEFVAFVAALPVGFKF